MEKSHTCFSLGIPDFIYNARQNSHWISKMQQTLFPQVCQIIWYCNLLLVRVYLNLLLYLTAWLMEGRRWAGDELQQAGEPEKGLEEMQWAAAAVLPSCLPTHCACSKPRRCHAQGRAPDLSCRDVSGRWREAHSKWLLKQAQEGKHGR